MSIQNILLYIVLLVNWANIEKVCGFHTSVSSYFNFSLAVIDGRCFICLGLSLISLGFDASQQLYWRHHNDSLRFSSFIFEKPCEVDPIHIHTRQIHITHTFSKTQNQHFDVNSIHLPIWRIPEAMKPPWLRLRSTWIVEPPTTRRIWWIINHKRIRF